MEKPEVDEPKKEEESNAIDANSGAELPQKENEPNKDEKKEVVDDAGSEGAEPKKDEDPDAFDHNSDLELIQRAMKLKEEEEQEYVHANSEADLLQRIVQEKENDVSIYVHSKSEADILQQKKRDEDFDPKVEAELLQKAMKPKKDEDQIIKLITKRKNAQRLKIKDEYKRLYNSDLIKDLQKALHGHFEDVVIGLFYSPIDYDCYQLRKAVKGLGTDEEALIEILSTRPPSIIKKIKRRYEDMFPGHNLLKDVEDDTSGNFRKILMSLIDAKRSMNNKILDYGECEKCAKSLYEAGEKRIGTDEDTFTRIFTEKSPHEFTVIAQIYYKLTKHTLLQAVEKEFHGNSKKCLIAIIYAIISPSEYFAKSIYKAVKGLGTDDSTLIRIIVSRSEIDIKRIKQFYKLNYKKDMIEDIKDDTSGNYRKILVELASR